MLSIQYNYATSHLHRRLGENQQAMGKAMEKISSGYRINTAADGPADLTMSEKLRAQIAGLERAMQNADNASNIMSVTEGGLSMAANLLQKMKGLALRAANTGVCSKDSIAADQAEMDSALQALGQIFNTTNIGGRKLMDTIMTKAGFVNPDATALAPANIVATPETYLRDALKGYNGLEGALILDGSGLPAGGAPSVENGRLANGDKTFVIYGLENDPEIGTELRFAHGEDLSRVLGDLLALTLPADFAPASGAEAFPELRTGLNPNTVEMSVGMLAHLHDLSAADGSAALEEYLNRFVATNRNGEIIQLSDDELKLLNLANTLRDGGLATIGGTEIVSGLDENGNKTYQTLTLNDLFSGGEASLLRDPEMAMKILDQALKDVLQTQAQVGAAQSMLQYGQGDLEAMMRAESTLRDTDIAAEATEFARAQINSQVCINLLAQVQKQYKESIINLLA